MDKQKITIGFLVLIVFSSFLYIQLNEDVRIRVDDDKTTFYVPHEEYSWIWTVGGREENRLFDGTSIMYRDVSGINVSKKIDGNEVWITRKTPYQRGPVVIDEYYFRGNISDEKRFPIYHKVRIINGSGYFYRYTVDDLTDTGEKRKLDGETELSFGKNMDVELQDGYRWAWVGWPYGSDSVSAQYDIESDDEIFSVRLFDPVPGITLNSPTEGLVNASLSQTLNVTIDDDDGDDMNVTFFLSSPYNFSALKFHNRSFSFSDQSSIAIDGLFFKPDGLKMYATGENKIYQYNLSKPWRLSSIINDSLSTASQTQYSHDIFISDDGTKLYESYDGTIYQYNLSEAWNINTSTYSHSVSSESPYGAHGLDFNPDGTKIYQLGLVDQGAGLVRKIHECNLSTAWDISTVSSTCYDYSASGGHTDMQFSKNGSFVYIVNSGGDDIHIHELTTPWDIRTASYTSTSYTFPTDETVMEGFFIDESGSTVYLTDDSDNNIYEFIPSIAVGTYNNQASGSDVTHGVSLEPSTTYRWYVNATDGDTTTVSNYSSLSTETQVSISFNNYSSNVVSEDGSLINVSTETSDLYDEVCLSADLYELGDDFSCGTGSTWYLWNASSGNVDFNDYWCYQEDAVEKNQVGTDGYCGLKYGGSYNFEDNLNDGNWSSSDYDRHDGIDGGFADYRYMTYNKPDNSYEAIWRWKDSSGTYDSSIPDDCWNYSNESLYFKGDYWAGTSPTYLSCQNGTSSYHQICARYGNPTPYEEAVIWKINGSETEHSLNYAPETINKPLDGFTNASIWKDGGILVRGNQTVYNKAYPIFFNETESGTECEDTWWTEYPCSNTYDGNYSSYGRLEYQSEQESSAVVYMNYTCDNCSDIQPDTSIYFKYGVTGSYDNYVNLSLDGYGCVLDPLQIKYELNGPFNTSGHEIYHKVVNAYCVDENNGGWNKIYTEYYGGYTYSPSYGYPLLKFYESSVYFNDLTQGSPKNFDDGFVKNLKIDFLNDDSYEDNIVGYLGINNTYINFFSDNKSYSSYNFSEKEEAKTSYLRTSSKLNSSRAVFNIEGNVNDRADINLYLESDSYTNIDGDVDRTRYSTVVGREGYGEGYKFGGTAFSGVCKDSGSTYNCTIKIDDENNRITQMSDVPYEVGEFSCSVYDPINDQIFVMGGKKGSTYQDDVYAYDPEEDSFTSKTSMPNPLAQHACSYYDGAIYVTGGYTTGDGTSETNDINKYNISSNSWDTSLTDLPGGKYNHFQGTISDGRLFVAGYVVDEPYIYNISGDSWTSGSDQPVITQGLSGAAGIVADYGKYVFLLGGYANSEYRSEVWRYDTEQDSWVVLSDELSETLYRQESFETDDHFIVYGSDGAYSFVWKVYLYPRNVEVYIGDETKQVFNGDLDAIQTYPDFSSSINSYIEDCEQEPDGSCLIPITIYNDNYGVVNLTSLEVVLNNSLIDFGDQTLTCGSSYCDANVSLYSEENGTINITEAYYNFYGPDNITFTADDDGVVDEKLVENHFTNYTVVLPDGANGISFYPFSVNTNVTPYGQNSNTPVLNITTENIEGNSNVSFKYVNPTSCINMYYRVGEELTGSYVDYTESFESDFGNWSNIATHDYDWERNSGTTGSVNTGPSSAYDGTYYIYVETSNGDGAYDNGDESIIEYDMNNSVDGYIDFYYHQYGDDQGNLSLEGYDGDSWNTIWWSSGNQLDSWNNENQSFSGYEKLRFKNVAAGGYQGDIALDLITVDATVSDSYSKAVNNTWTDIWNGKPDDYNEGFYLTANYNCSSSFTGFFAPDFYLRSCYSEADICDEGVN